MYAFVILGPALGYIIGGQLLDVYDDLTLYYFILIIRYNVCLCYFGNCSWVHYWLPVIRCVCRF